MSSLYGCYAAPLRTDRCWLREERIKAFAPVEKLIEVRIEEQADELR